jgi:flagellar motor switch protein FliN/FliY
MEAGAMEYAELGPAEAAAEHGADLGRLQNVPVEVAVEIGRTRMTIGEALALAPGTIVTVGRLTGEPVDLLVNGRAIARGEIVAVDEELGLRITEIAAPVVEPAEGEQAEEVTPP